MKKLMTHIVAGYPSMDVSEKLLYLMAESGRADLRCSDRSRRQAGVDFIEIQIPFSDLVADGPTIMRANQVSLEGGTTVEKCFRLMRKAAFGRGISDKPKFLFMTYFNILHHYGVEKFCKKAAECGCYGLIVPDMPIDEEPQEKYLENCREYGLNAIQVISPLTPERRLKMIAKVAQGFVYCVSRFGTTGQGAALNPKLSEYLKKVKKYIDLPLAVGFGISEKTHVEAVWKEADIAVIGSKIINILDESGGDLKQVEFFLKRLRQ